ncbi:MAG: manganese efflux pump [Lachnospiraceae bacterium]|nr:manganese efflux pump [Lachnospiraceae bacterium]
MSFVLIVNSLLLGVGLAMDAFSVSLANGLHEPQMKKGRMSAIAGTFALFQTAMPLIGWFCVHTLVSYFKAFQPFIPWIALALLGFIGGKMLYEGLRPDEEEEESTGVGFAALMLQGVATSIDALSVGFTISDYNALMAVAAAVIIGVVTFVICLGGLKLGKIFGTKLAGKATILGGLILIGIGIEIFVTSMF